MTREEELKQRYFDWLYKMVCEGRFAKDISYEKLLSHLHSTEFNYIIPNDENRAADGIDLRRRFGTECDCLDISNYVKGPCSVLEMIVALANRCEETIMDDPSIGNRTGQWFWNMIMSLGLGSMTDDIYNDKNVSKILDKFLNRQYEADGKGGLFTIPNCERDLREVEIWYIMCWYLDRIV